MTFRIDIIIQAFLLLAVLSACDQDITMQTTVYPDGSLDKTIHIAHTDHAVVQAEKIEIDKPFIITRDSSVKNILGLRVEDGWALAAREVPEADDTTTVYTFHRHFSSVDEANATLATPVDSLFRVTSTFEKKFRWFYTYIYYADTYHAINRMDYPLDDYVTPEDYSFIDRLPAEGKKITPADSLYLTRLHDKLFDDYGSRALFEDYYNLLIKFLQEKHLENRWIDTLRVHKNHIIRKMKPVRDAIDDDYVLHLLDSMGIPVSDIKKSGEWPTLTDHDDGKLNFITYASEAKYHHQINMPWEVVRTNADSISGKQLFWSPPSIKFLLKDYTLYAESRQLNYWTVAISGGVIALTFFLFIRRRQLAR